jgi:hypothetical protein
MESELDELVTGGIIMTSLGMCNEGRLWIEAEVLTRYT